MTVVCMKKRMSGSRRIRRVIVAKKRMRMSDVCRQREVVGATHAATPLNGDGEVEAAQETSMEVPQDGESPMRRRVAVMVEPSPFSHVSGMRNRFLTKERPCEQRETMITGCSQVTGQVRRA